MYGKTCSHSMKTEELEITLLLNMFVMVFAGGNFCMYTNVFAEMYVMCGHTFDRPYLVVTKNNSLTISSSGY